MDTSFKLWGAWGMQAWGNSYEESSQGPWADGADGEDLSFETDSQLPEVDSDSSVCTQPNQSVDFLRVRS